MKHITLLAIAAAFALPMQGQVIFVSGFEDWTGNTPDGWGGIRTNLPQSGVQQVSDDVHGGAFAVRLIRAAVGHQRYTTQDVEVVSGQAYNVNFWVRGEGQIRLGLYDGRPTSSGYAPYTNYVNVTGNVWTEVNLSITAAMDATDGQFILSLQNTVEPEHLVVDDVTISLATVEPPQSATIQEIQETTAPDGASPLAGTVVITEGVVSGLITGTNSGFFMQDGSGPWSGIFVFSAPTGLLVGDRVSVTGTVVEFNGQTQLATVTNTIVLSNGVSIPETTISTAAANTEPYESVLVTVNAATCTASGAFGQFTVNDGTGATLTDDVIFAFPFQVGAVYNITGVLQFAFNEWRILPRDANDVEVVTGMEDLLFAGVSLYPNPASDLLMLDLGTVEGRTELVLTDIAGRVVRADVLVQERNSIHVADLAAGSYVLSLRNGSSVWSTRVMVQR